MSLREGGKLMLYLSPCGRKLAFSTKKYTIRITSQLQRCKCVRHGLDCFSHVLHFITAHFSTFTIWLVLSQSQ